MTTPPVTRPRLLTDKRDTQATAVARRGTLAAASSVHGTDGGLWSHTTPEAMARMARDLFGASAAEAITWCALSARRAHHQADARFWRAVLIRLDAPGGDEAS
jgi:hypothetical protein